jgi:hypothetical protein
VLLQASGAPGGERTLLLGVFLLNDQVLPLILVIKLLTASGARACQPRHAVVTTFITC